jgi:hypothetical protein
VDKDDSVIKKKWEWLPATICTLRFKTESTPLNAIYNFETASTHRKATIKAEWMIATESPPQADLRPLGIVLNEQL